MIFFDEMNLIHLSYILDQWFGKEKENRKEKCWEFNGLERLNRLTFFFPFLVPWRNLLSKYILNSFLIQFMGGMGSPPYLFCGPHHQSSYRWSKPFTRRHCSKGNSCKKIISSSIYKHRYKSHFYFIKWTVQVYNHINLSFYKIKYNLFLYL